jgi:hypothetical protein
MSYELAKELKEAGFPQQGKGEIVMWKHAASGPSTKSLDTAYLPTLSELIEACGDDFYSLVNELLPHSFHKWRAASKTDVWINDASHGPTPEEAVARLWLALKKHD